MVIRVGGTFYIECQTGNVNRDLIVTNFGTSLLGVYTEYRILLI